LEEVYAKLVYGNNLPALRGSGPEYHPKWTGEERRTLYEVLGKGLSMFRALTASSQTETGA
jgi:hypothetical protein